MSAVHGPHSKVPVGWLDPTCERCQEMRVGDLDSGHLVNVCGLTRPQLEAQFGDSPFWDAIVNERALRMLARYREVQHRRTA